MKSNLLATKFYQPAAPQKRILRPLLIQRLTQGLENGRQLTLISAPAGFGKTICASEWVSSVNLPVAWLSLDSADNDPVRFLLYFIAALQRVKPAIGREIEGALQTGQLPPLDVIITTLVNDILDAENKFLLVLDDFHVIQENAVLTILEKLVINQPDQVHLVLVTREDPLLPLARLRANNRMTELRAADLRFSHDEAVHFLNAIMGLSLSEQDVTALGSLTEGWVVGLQLAAIAMQSLSSKTDRQDPSRFIAAVGGSHRYILSYLTEEVLSRQTEEAQNFLLETSILDQLNGDLCDAVTGRTDSRLLLERLFTANLFLIPMDDEQRWYRYHHLFADLLRKQLKPERVAGLHQKASRWYEQAGMANQAIEHALAAADYQSVVRLLEQHAMTLVNQGYARTVESWMQAIPEAWHSQSPRANLAFAWMYLLRGSYQRMVPYLSHADAAITQMESSGADGENQPQAKVLRAEIYALQSALFSVQGRSAESSQMAEQALQLSGPEDYNIRGLAYFRLAGAAREAGDAERAVDAYHQAIQNSRAAGNLVSEILSVAQLALMARQNGQMHFAADVCSQSIAYMERAGFSAPIAGAVYGALGVTYYEWNQIEKAHAYLQRGIQLSNIGGHNAAEIFIKCSLAWILQAEGNPEAASRSLQAALDLFQLGAPSWLKPELVDYQVRVYLAQNKPTQAELALRQYGIRGGDPELSAKMQHPNEAFYLAYLRMIAYQARENRTRTDQIAEFQEGIAIADSLAAQAAEAQRMGIAIQARVLQALICSAIGNIQDSLDSLERALCLGEPEGYVRTFVDEGQPMFELLQQYQHRKNTQYITRLIQAFPQAETGSLNQKPVVQETARVANLYGIAEPLTERELDVLRAMADGLKYEEIAERLVISLNTVRFYVKAIYSKLGVNNRTKAIEMARQIRLL